MVIAADWICCHLGAREHYAIPRALHRWQRLRGLVTDAWLQPGHPTAHVPGDAGRRLAERFHPDLAGVEVRELTLSLITHEVERRLQGHRDWGLVMARNQWFQREAARALADFSIDAGRPMAVFAHSYSARAIFESAKARGWMTVLGQIDPGEEHFATVRRLSEGAPQYGPPPPAPPAEYFASWREECRLADRIVVNSEWSRQTITRAGIGADRIRVLPLVYEAEGESMRPADYPERFTADRPLKLLFVGSLAVAKGIPELLEAMAMLRDQPVTLTLVGPEAMSIPADARHSPSLVFVGSVPRGKVFRYYASSDVLVFPSHSDGFGMAQIEAQACGLPVIASKRCGHVVDDGVSGVLLGEVTAGDVAGAVRRLLTQPSLLGTFAAAARRTARPTLSTLGEGLIDAIQP